MQAETFTDVTIDGTDAIFGAGNAGEPSGSTPPVEEALAPGATTLTFSSVTGTITLNGGGNYNDPDGVAVNGNYITASYTNDFGGISGTKAANGGYLVGVFTAGTVPDDAIAPTDLDFYTPDSGSINPDFASLSPELDQTFYIGDGLTGDGTGSVQTFYVPAGATELYLGISDAPNFVGTPGSYGDNSGDFLASFTVAETPEPGSVGLLLGGLFALGLGWRFARRSSLA